MDRQLYCGLRSRPLRVDPDRIVCGRRLDEILTSGRTLLGVGESELPSTGSLYRLIVGQRRDARRRSETK